MRLDPSNRRGGREGQLALLRSVALAALCRELHPDENAGVRVALDQVNEEVGGEPTVPMVVEALLHPREAMEAGISAAGAEQFAAATRDVDLSAMRDSEALAS